ncbi:MAG: hypothetical protein WCJ97_08980 [Phycisphaerae bacterium]
MLRWLLNITFGLFVLLSLLTAGLWVVSARYCIAWDFGYQDRPSQIMTSPGRIEFWQGGGDEPRWQWDVFRMNATASAGPLQTLRRGLENTEWFLDDEPAGWSVSLPIGWFWLGITLYACLLGAYLCILRRKQKQKRIRAGLCPKCAYDLRASQDRCPECGTPIADKLTEISVPNPLQIML